MARKHAKPPAPPTSRAGLEQALTQLLWLALLLWAVAWWQQDRLPPPANILPDLTQAPLQTPLAAPPFRFNYRAHTYEVRTFAAYELWGLVVSHNDIASIGDIYHTADSLDTKDICVIWGDNVGRADYLNTHFSSGAWTCYYQYPAGIRFNPEAMSNNHLITDDASIRATIAGLRRGDQIHLRGRLVGYRDVQADGDFWRNSSLTRSDSSNGACEVVLVEGVERLQTAHPHWQQAYRVGRSTALVLLVLRGLLLLRVLLRPADPRLTRPLRR